MTKFIFENRFKMLKVIEDADIFETQGIFNTFRLL